MNWPIKLICESICLLAVAFSAAFVAWDLHQTQIGIRASIAPIGATVAKVNQALDTINRPCASGPCGALAEVDKTIVKVGDAIVTTQLQERTTAPHVVAAMDQFKDSAAHLSKTADALADTARAGAGTLESATAAIGEGQRTIAAIQPLAASLMATAAASTATINSLNVRISDPRIDRIIGYAETTTGHVDAIAGDAQRVADKTAGDILAPKPWWQKLPGYANDLVRAGCLITGRCP
jgi:methyl-accepting chemotaxis protein